jgi:hypothetical protein
LSIARSRAALSWTLPEGGLPVAMHFPDVDGFAL